MFYDMIKQYCITLYVNLSSSYNILSYYTLQYCKIYYNIVHVFYQIESQKHDMVLYH